MCVCPAHECGGIGEQQVYLYDRMIMIIFVLSVLFRYKFYTWTFISFLKFIGHKLMPAHGVTDGSALAKKKEGN
jgi:hypothetical protein